MSRALARSRAAAVVGASLVAAAGCDFTSFDTYRANTPVLALIEPSDYPSLAFAVDLGYAGGSATGGDWVITSGGLGDAIVALPVRAGGALAPHTPPSRILCSMASPCGGTTATGTALAGLGSWQGMTECALTGAFSDVHRVHVMCVGSGNPTGVDITPPHGFETSGFGLGLAVPRRRAGEGPTADLVLVGAPEEVPGMPSSTMAPGAIFLATPTSVTNVTPANVASGAALGTVLALGRAGSATVIAAGSPQLGLVYVLRGDPGGLHTAPAFACIEHSDEPGFGGAVALGDFDGDGADDVAVGDDAAAVGRTARVHVYLAANAPPAGSACSPTAWPEARVECANAPDRGFECAGGDEGFGAALAAGDLDGDGRDELAVAAPVARVDAVEGAGAIVVYTAHGTGGAFAFDATGHVARLASPVQSGALGARVLVGSVNGRDELFATAQGARAVYAFLCTGLPGDSPDAPGLDMQCRPTM